MLQVKNLTVTHKKDNRTLIDNLSFSLDQGDKMAVIGEEGNGKSTLLKCIRDPGMVESYGEISGEILTGGAVIGYLPQELSPALVPGSSDRSSGSRKLCGGQAI